MVRHESEPEGGSLTKAIVGIVLVLLTGAAGWAGNMVTSTQRDNTRRITALEQQMAVNSAQHETMLLLLNQINDRLKEQERAGRRGR